MWGGRKEKDRRRAYEKESWLCRVIESLKSQMIEQTEHMELTVAPSDSMDGDLRLPKDIVQMICSNLAMGDMMRLSQCSKANRGYILYKLDDLWKQLLPKTTVNTLVSVNWWRKSENIGTTWLGCARYLKVYQFAWSESCKQHAYLIAKASIISMALEYNIRIPHL